MIATAELETSYEQQRLAHLLELKRQKLDWVKAHRIYFYRPYSLQQQAFHESQALTRLVVGTNRSGKTTCGAVEDIACALGFRPWLLPADLLEQPIEELLRNFRELPASCKTFIKPPVKGLVVVADWDVADDIWTTGNDEAAGKLKYYIPEGALDGPPEKNNMGNICAYHFKNGSILSLDTQKSFVNDPQSFEGKRIDFAHYDEPPRRDLRVSVARGLVDRNGREVFTLTPLTEPWIKNELFDKAATDPTISTHFLHAKENPYISKAGWDKFVGTLNEDERAARAEGEWLYLRGLVYKEFVPKLYKADGTGGNLSPDLEPEWVAANGTLYLSIDPHPRQPHMALLLVATKDKQWVVWREIYKHCLIEELCAFIETQRSYVSKTGPVVLDFMRQICDPLAFEEDPIDGRCWADEFSNRGLLLEKAPKRKAQGILSTKQALSDQRLLVCQSCHRTIWEFQNYKWGEWKNKIDRNEKEKPEDKDDHAMECLYRLVLLEPEFIPVEEKESKPVREFQYV